MPLAAQRDVVLNSGSKSASVLLLDLSSVPLPTEEGALEKYRPILVRDHEQKLIKYCLMCMRGTVVNG